MDTLTLNARHYRYGNLWLVAFYRAAQITKKRRREDEKKDKERKDD